MMQSSNDLTALSQLSEDVLAEVVREGELQVQAQLQTSLAADSRALTIAGSCLTAATALFGATAALSKAKYPDYPLMTVAAGLGLLLLLAAGLAIFSARPVAFDFPGNEPANWLPANWHKPPGKTGLLKCARIEQAITLQEIIEGNRGACANNALLIRIALWLAYGGGVAAGVAVLAILAHRA